MKTKVLIFTAIVAAASWFPALLPAATISTASLLEDMTNLVRMAEFPSPAYTCKQFSSYDRASKSPAENWFANGDSGQYLRVEERNGRKEYVMMDAAGPGAIVLIWSANPAGTLRVYLDGATKPVIESPITNVLGGRFSGWPRPISGEYSKGWNLYFPIPYAKSCKVTTDRGDLYYHIDYRAYEPRTSVETFSLERLMTLAPQVRKIITRLNSPRGEDSATGGQAERLDQRLGPGQTVRKTLAGSKALTRMLFKIDAADQEAALRGLIMRITFDGESCVQAPLGDFFGSAPGINPYSGLPLGMTREGEMYCHWFMPFKESAVIEFANYGPEPVTVRGECALADYEWTESSMHFHAKWRAQFDVPTRPLQDWNYLTAKGQGVFAGVAFAIDNPVKDWWGEGDEKIYVDGETFPSFFGTGTEDYYGYGWCAPQVFTHPYHAQPRVDGPANYGRTSVNRFHILDRIPFTKDFKFDMELWHWSECKVNMAVTAYWYAKPGASDGFNDIRPEDAILRPMPPWTPPRVDGALEGESLRIIRVTGTAEPQAWDTASNGKQLWWNKGMKPGDTLTVGFPAPKPGLYHVLAGFLLAKDYGIHQFAINGKAAGAPIDFYNPEVKPSLAIDLGVFELKQGENELSATVVGSNPKAIKSYMLGLDYLLLKPVE